MVNSEFYPDWEAVYRHNVDRVYRLMFAKVGNRADAEDLTAEVFLAALRPLRVSASVAEVRAYLSATARTVLARHWRHTLGREITTISAQPEGAAADTPMSSASTRFPEFARSTECGEPTESVESVEVSARADAVLAGLPEQYRRILRLRFLEGYSVREAATALGVSVGNAKVMQHRALRRAAQLSDEVKR